MPGGPPAGTASGSGRIFKASEMKRIGDDMLISPMGAGTWQWGNRILYGYDPDQDTEIQAVFDRLVGAGINLFDTGDSYGTGALNGRAELLLGRFIREYEGPQPETGIHVATKLAAYPWRITPRNMVAACRGSLRRTGLESLSAGQLHWSAANYAPLQEWAQWNGLADAYDQGLIQNVGVSNYGPKQLRKVHSKFAGRGVPLRLAQVQFSLLSWGPQQQELLETCDELGITLISYSPLALGMLTGRYDADNLPEGPRAALFRKILPEIQPITDCVGEVAGRRRKTPSQVAIRWCMDKGTVPIPGARTLQQADDNLGALGWSLSAAEMQALDDAADEVFQGGNAMVQNVFQTT